MLQFRLSKHSNRNYNTLAKTTGPRQRIAPERNDYRVQNTSGRHAPRNEPSLGNDLGTTMSEKLFLRQPLVGSSPR
jgi:hypothetical protein